LAYFLGTIDTLKFISDLAVYALGILKLGEWAFSAFKSWWRQHRPPAKEVIERRIKMRQDIEQHLQWSKRYINKPATETHLATCIEVIDFEEIIIRDIRRMDEFPEIDKEGIGISSWFKVTVVGLYDRGIEVFLSDSRSVIQTENGWCLLPPGRHSESALFAASVGRIPFHFIERIDWSRSDPYYFAPHFYCHFSGPLRRPYEDVIYKAKLYPSVSENYQEIGLRAESYEWGILKQRVFLLRQDIARYWRLLRKLARSRFPQV
jgi:hypothetical protein